MTHDFKWRHFRGEIIPWAVRWHCRYGVSYRDLEEMLEERSVAVDHTTIHRRVQAYAPEVERRLRWHCQLRSFARSWRVDETCIKVKSKWAHLHRAVDSRGDTIDFRLSQTRNAKAAKRFPGKALRGCKEWQKPCVINTDKAGCDGQAIRRPYPAGFRYFAQNPVFLPAEQGEGFCGLRFIQAAFRSPGGRCEGGLESASSAGFPGIRVPEEGFQLLT